MGQGHSGGDVPIAQDWHQVGTGGDDAGNSMPRKKDTRLSCCKWLVPSSFLPWEDKVSSQDEGQTSHTACVWLLSPFRGCGDSTQMGACGGGIWKAPGGFAFCPVGPGEDRGAPTQWFPSPAGHHNPLRILLTIQSTGPDLRPAESKERGGAQGPYL